MIKADNTVQDHDLTIRISIPVGTLTLRTLDLSPAGELERETAARLLAETFGFVIDPNVPVTVTRI